MNHFSYTGRRAACRSRRSERAGREGRHAVLLLFERDAGAALSRLRRLRFRTDTLVAFSVKANGNIAVLKTLARLGAGADVVSGGELKKALHAGIPAERIVFSGVGKTQSRDEARRWKPASTSSMSRASRSSQALSEVATALGTTAPITIRVNPDVDAKTHAKITTGTSETKFGIPWSRARGAYALAAKLPGIQIVGIDVHIGSQIVELEPFETRVRQGRRTDGAVARRWTHDRAARSRRRAWRALCREQRAAARSVGLWQDGDAGDQGRSAASSSWSPGG